MKLPKPFKQTKTRLGRIAILTAVTFGWGAAGFAQEAATGQGRPVAPANQTLTTNQAPSRPLSRGVAEIVKLADAGVSLGVIKTYAECSPIPYQPTDVDIIALKQHKVGDEIVTVLLKRGAQVRAALAQARNEALARALAARRMAAGGLDPESYEYFQHYYLQPRALASAYERLAPYYYPPAYPYGGPGAMAPGAPIPNGPGYPPR